MRDDSDDEIFDAKTFHLLRRSCHLRLRATARELEIKLERLARLRAWDENIGVADAWVHIFDVGRMRADLLCFDDFRASLASTIWQDLAHIRGQYQEYIASRRPPNEGLRSLDEEDEAFESRDFT